MRDWMLDEWLKPNYEPQRENKVVLADNFGHTRVGYLACEIDDNTGACRWQLVDDGGISTYFDEEDVLDADADAGRITIKRTELKTAL